MHAPLPANQAHDPLPGSQYKAYLELGLDVENGAGLFDLRDYYRFLNGNVR